LLLAISVQFCVCAIFDETKFAITTIRHHNFSGSLKINERKDNYYEGFLFFQQKI